VTVANKIKAAQFSTAGLLHATNIIQAVCRLAGSPSFIDDVRADLEDSGVISAVEQHDTATVFDWLVDGLSYQGIANQIAYDYMQQHGQATWADIRQHLAATPSCPKLQSYWRFNDCRYQKGSQTCAEPDHFDDCPVPSHDLRNGRLNQTAYSLFLFIRDLAAGDLVAWVDERLAEADHRPGDDRLARLRETLLGPLRNVVGVSDKVWSMTLASLLLGAGAHRPRWTEVGGSMVAVDTLVHNFLHRTGILGRLNANHPYGPGCYRPLGCAKVLETVARQIDARQFNARFPAIFPRFVQNAVWRYCGQTEFDVCNGNKIDDRTSCNNAYCRIRSRCDRVQLYSDAESTV
jgi:hypothetical protein